MKTRLFMLLPATRTPPPHHHHLFSRQTPAMTSPYSAARRRRQKKVVVIMGPTGCGKSRLSIDLASRFFGPSSEIVNCDKIQVHRGLDVTTNKIPVEERRRVTHHLLGEFSSRASEFSASDFRSSASRIIAWLHRQRKTPFVVGGSNSFIYALLAERYDPRVDPFAGSSEGDDSFCRELRYNCCFIWVDVELRVLNSYLARRVDEMLGSGMYEELVEYFDDDGGLTSSSLGLRKAIGVAEFERYFKVFGGGGGGGDDVAGRAVAYEEAVREVKDNTCRLAKRQVGKIMMLRDCAGWDLNRVDATAAVEAAMGGDSPEEVWEREVVGPSVEIVKAFLER